jgi:hypothetical protein
MSKKALTTIVSLTFVVWLVRTGVYNLPLDSRGTFQTSLFSIIVAVDSLTGKLPLTVFCLIFIIVVELTVRAMTPLKRERPYPVEPNVFITFIALVPAFTGAYLGVLARSIAKSVTA